VVCWFFMTFAAGTTYDRVSDLVHEEAEKRRPTFEMDGFLGRLEDVFVTWEAIKDD